MQQYDFSNLYAFTDNLNGNRMVGKVYSKALKSEYGTIRFKIKTINMTQLDNLTVTTSKLWQKSDVEFLFITQEILLNRNKTTYVNIYVDIFL